ncbi:Uma2 family endonuclease [Streptomyces cylindrosporus]|uniref:Uma2 family endonuclease n=1 Tax=Streptomyces cylindrosporus TaxID=2927583 RepID=A0ABS9YG99_9ACTN|nr:Uma2 family endonuclease [Streptomyces cylindrosporus]MCI3275969.1 Uma2 family endonuclease [Streptomyces cylindrosporus]
MAWSRRTGVLEAEAWLTRELEGYRGEVLYGRLTATPLADAVHQVILTDVAHAFSGAGAREAGLKCLLGIGLWLPTGSDDFAVPDLSVVEQDFRGKHVQHNCYAPDGFRLVMEVTADNWSDDLGPKAECYAQAGIPAYLIADRKHDEVLLYTDPVDGKYPDPARYKRGQSVPVPESVGVTLDLSVDTLLDGDD